MGTAHGKPSISAAAAAPAPDRRRFPRSACGEEVTILWAGPKLTGIVHDVSERGMCFSVDRTSEASRFAVGTPLRLLLKPPEPEGKCAAVNVVGEVVRLNLDDARGRIVVAVAFERP